MAIATQGATERVDDCALPGFPLHFTLYNNPIPWLLLGEQVNAWVCWIIVFVGAALMWKGARIQLKAQRAKSWPSVPGRVLESSLRAVLDNRGRTYRAYILYEYAVGGVTRRSDVWRLGVGTSSFTKGSTEVVERYPVGTAVTVFFDPDNPADAMLEPGNASWFLFVAGMLFAGAGVLLLFKAT
jgi:hypothetical protein